MAILVWPSSSPGLALLYALTLRLVTLQAHLKIPIGRHLLYVPPLDALPLLCCDFLSASRPICWSVMQFLAATCVAHVALNKFAADRSSSSIFREDLYL
jgi:hypothetical protein